MQRKKTKKKMSGAMAAEEAREAKMSPKAYAKHEAAEKKKLGPKGYAKHEAAERKSKKR